MPIAERIGVVTGVKSGIARLAIAVCGLAVATVAGVLDAGSEPLAKEACDTIQSEHATLAAAGLAETIKKGAVWGKANLSAVKLKEVERFIGLEEQLQFRCGLARLRVLPGAEPEETGDTDKAATEKPAAETVAPAAVAVVPKPKAKLKPATDVAPVTENAEAAAKPKPKPKPKPKADDAFKPPPAVKE